MEIGDTVWVTSRNDNEIKPVKIYSLNNFNNVVVQDNDWFYSYNQSEIFDNELDAWREQYRLLEGELERAREDIVKLEDSLKDIAAKIYHMGGKQS